ncbi:bladder cancer-related protein BC10-domain-containing protein [Xylariales sp. AK1849]|nr:bladder cancer-related protein BC10-domain-containing protein [Xylariales sp. AK1849]
MFCLRSWLPLLFIPTNASPAFIFLFFVCTYFLNRPCVYCSILLLILFVTSCYWSDRCFFDFSSNWFAPRPSTPYYPLLNSSQGGNSTTVSEQAVMDGFNATAFEMLNTTASALAGAAVEELARKKAEWTGLGVEWLRSMLGKREWRIECMDLYIRL